MTDNAIAATALIADDEPLLREHLASHLARLWPALEIVAEARNGREAIEAFEEHEPDIVFLDVHMPGLNGIDAARSMTAPGSGIERPMIVFVTAYEHYAVQAFERGALDYLVKPFDPARLAETVQRLQAMVALRRQRQPAEAEREPADHEANPAFDDLLARMAEALRARAPAQPWLQWIKASVGTSVRVIPVDELIYLRSDEKYTLVVHAGGEALIRRGIRELADELDPQRFVQVHRSVIVNLRHVSQVTRGPNETAELQLRGRSELLPVSRSYLHLFRQM